MKKERKAKEPSLFSKLITVYWEQAKRRKALRYLSKQDWSFEFLCLMLIKSSRVLGKGIQMEIVNRDGQKIHLTYTGAAQANTEQLDDSIFNHLDDDTAIADFIRRNSTR